jgi:hypothetical protein
MPIIFQKPIGAHADLRELEYVSALHQTGATLRRDGSVTGKLRLEKGNDKQISVLYLFFQC